MQRGLAACGESRVQSVFNFTTNLYADKRRMRPTLVILTVPRSGSSWLASLCRSTGVLGQPREWLNSVVSPAAPHRIPVPPPGPDRSEALLGALAKVAGSTNGVVGVKVTTYRWHEFPTALHAWGIGDGQSDAWVGTLFPRAAVVVLRRRDRIGQAISWWRSLQSGRFARFVGDDEVGAIPPYDSVQLRAALADILRLEATLDRAAESFRSHAAAVTMDMAYEEALLDPLRAVRRIADLAEVPLDASLAPSTDLLVQRDEATEAIRTRFEADLADGVDEAVR